MVSILSALLACATPSPGEEEGTDATSYASPPDSAAVWNPTPEWTPAEAMALAWDGMSLDFPKPGPVSEVYLELLSHGDVDCPGDNGQQIVDSDATHAGCTAASGYTFIGSTTYTDSTTTENDRTSIHRELTGGFAIRDPDGVGMAGGGVSLYGGEDSGDGYHWGATFGGTWDSPLVPGCLSDGASGLLSITGAELVDGSWWMTLDGGLSCGTIDVAFEDLSYGTTCPDGPSGVLAVRDPSGLWGRFDFGSSCEGCGTFTWDLSESSIPACLDLSPAMATLRQDLAHP